MKIALCSLNDQYRIFWKTVDRISPARALVPYNIAVKTGWVSSQSSTVLGVNVKVRKMFRLSILHCTSGLDLPFSISGPT